MQDKGAFTPPHLAFSASAACQPGTEPMANRRQALAVRAGTWLPVRNRARNRAAKPRAGGRPRPDSAGQGHEARVCKVEAPQAIAPLHTSGRRTARASGLLRRLEPAAPIWVRRNDVISKSPRSIEVTDPSKQRAPGKRGHTYCLTARPKTERSRKKSRPGPRRSAKPSRTSPRPCE